MSLMIAKRQTSHIDAKGNSQSSVVVVLFNSFLSWIPKSGLSRCKVVFTLMVAFFSGALVADWPTIT